MITSTMTFEQTACQILSEEIGETFTYRDGNYVSEYSNFQLIDHSTFLGWARERWNDNGNGEPSHEELEDAWNDHRKILIDYNLDEHGKRYSEFYAIIDQLNG